MAHEAGKGDTQRPTNHKSFSENFEKIFGKKDAFDEAILEEIVEDEEENDGICPACSGSGEGMHDGSTCYKCGGSGDWSANQEDDV